MVHLVVGLPVETKHPTRLPVGLVLLELVMTVGKVIARLAEVEGALGLLAVTVTVSVLVVTAEMAYQTLLLVLL